MNRPAPHHPSTTPVPAAAPAANGSTATSFRHHMERLPRAVRWAIYGGAVILGLLLYSDYVLALRGGWDDQAQQYQRALDAAAALEQAGFKSRNVVGAMIVHGPIEVPEDEPATSAALRQAVNDIVARHKVSRDAFQTDAGGKLKRGTMESILRGGEARYVQGTLDFESNIDTAFKLICDLEADPAIEAITSLRISKAKGDADFSSRLVKVRVTLRAWAITPAGTLMKVASR